MSCPDPAGCPVPVSSVPARLETFVIEKGTSWYNVARHSAVFNSQGVGETRFAPLFDAAGQPIPHVYLANNPVGALLETALHDVWGVTSVVQRCDLRGRCLRRLTAKSDLTVYDLRDAALNSCGVMRSQIISTPSEHYSCTRRWANALLDADARDSAVAGFLWHSRQAEIAAVHARPALLAILKHVEQFPHTAVIYDTAALGDHQFASAIEYHDLSVGDGLELVIDISVQLGLHVEE